jgi:hypothetical protein
MSTSKAHLKGMNSVGLRMYPDGHVAWRDPKPPATTGRSRHGQLRGCDYCGSMHPSDVVAAIAAGANGSWADWKYGWPHKAYFDGIPNPHVGLLEVKSSANFKPEGRDDWIQDGEHWHEPPTPAPALTHGKFYSVHLKDATPEEKEIIEKHLGIHVEFEGELVRWKRL